MRPGAGRARTAAEGRGYAAAGEEKMKDWKDFKRPETVIEAFEWLVHCTTYGHGFNWSIQCYGYGEHFTFWPGDGTFTDFSIDRGTAISCDKMLDILIESGQVMYDHLRKDSPHLFEEGK